MEGLCTFSAWMVEMISGGFMYYLHRIADMISGGFMHSLCMDE
jgi:hypothetical protein